MVSHPLTGNWRLAWTHQRISPVNLQHISYGLLPRSPVRVANLHQLIYVERKTWIDVLDLEFPDGQEATWTVQGVITSFNPSHTVPIELHVEFQQAILRSPPTHWLAPYSDKEFRLAATAKATTTVLGSESRVDCNAEGQMTLLRRVL